MKLKSRFALLFGTAVAAGSLLALAAATTLSFMGIKDLGADIRAEVGTAMSGQMADSAEALLISFGTAVRDPLYFNDFKGIDKIAKAVDAAPNVVGVRVFDASGITIHDGLDGLAHFGEPVPEKLSGKLEPGAVVHWNDGEILQFGTPVCIDGECVGTVMVSLDGKVLSGAVAVLDDQVKASEQGFIRRLSMLGAAVLIATIFIATVSGLTIAGRISSPIRRLTEIFTSVANGEHEVKIPSQERNDEIGELARTLSSFLDISLKSAQSQSALEVASAKFMITDADWTIVGLNHSAIGMFRAAEADLCEELADFSMDNLVGETFQSLVGNETAKAIDEALSIVAGGDDAGADDNAAARHDIRVEIGRRTFDLTVTPVLNAKSERLGFAVEWTDRTQQLATEREVAGIVQAAGQGVFSQRLDEDGKDGFMLQLAQGMNELVENVEKGLSQISDVMSAFADGDLTKRMDDGYKGEFMRLRDYSNRMGDQMVSIVAQIGKVTNAVQSAAGEISAGVSDLSVRTEHQASSLEETSASMEELAATVRQNSDNADEADRAATAARNVALNGGGLANQAVSAMDEIADSSKKITEIVGLIQEIAFQTNLLALNASVEAARAGEAGRGFAVVANEVRALAQRAASASKDIKELILNTDDQIQSGVTMVNNAGNSLEEIVASVKIVADYVSEIAAASREQTSGIEQVSSSMTAMDEMTQQNATLVEETTLALASAEGQISELKNTVGFFRIENAAEAIGENAAANTDNEASASYPVAV
jgi:methyl-accepting chemotaxis protein